jgi:hypothetical protein
LRGLKVKIPIDGEWRKVARVHRGEPVLYTAEEWQNRESEGEDLDPVWKWVWFPLLSLLIAWLFFGRDGTLFWIIFGIIHVVMWNTFYPVSLRHHMSRERSRGGYTGLFVNGVQWRLVMYSETFFLPYSEIIDLDLVDRGKGKVLEFHIRGFRKPWAFDTLWDVLGPEGMKELRARVEAAQCRVVPPKLVVYDDRRPTGSTGIPMGEVVHRSPALKAPMRL